MESTQDDCVNVPQNNLYGREVRCMECHQASVCCVWNGHVYLSVPLPSYWTSQLINPLAPKKQQIVNRSIQEIKPMGRVYM